MNFEINKVRVDEVEIDIKSIIEQFIRKIGLVVALAIVFAMLVSSMMYIKDVSEYNSIVNGQVDTMNPVELTNNDKIAINNYLLLQSKVDQLAEYGDNSIILGIDFNAAYQGRMQYYVDAPENVKYDIAYVISTYVNNGVLASKISELEGYPKATYIQEILSSDISGTSNGINSGVVNVRVLGRTEEECEKYMNEVCAQIEDYVIELQEKMGKHSVTLVHQECTVRSMSEVYTLQKSYYTETKTANSELNSSKAALTDVQKRAVAELLADEEQNESNNIVSKPEFKISYVVIGAILGVFVAIFVVLADVLFGGKLQSEKELLKRFNVSDLGSISVNDAKWINKFVIKVLHGKSIKEKEEQVNSICARLQLYMQESQNKKICLISTSDDIEREYIKELSDTIAKKGISCDIIGNVLASDDALEKMSNAENIVLIETLGKSKVKEIYEEAMICLNAGAKVVGYITVRG